MQLFSLSPLLHSKLVNVPDLEEESDNSAKTVEGVTPPTRSLVFKTVQFYAKAKIKKLIKRVHSFIFYSSVCNCCICSFIQFYFFEIMTSEMII